MKPQPGSFLLWYEEQPNAARFSRISPSPLGQSPSDSVRMLRKYSTSSSVKRAMSAMKAVRSALPCSISDSRFSHEPVSSAEVSVCVPSSSIVWRPLAVATSALPSRSM